MKTTGDFLFERCVREHVAGDLFNAKLVVGQIGVQCVDDPVAIPPRMGASPVFLIAIAIGVAGQVKPMPPPAFTIVW